MWGNVWEWRVRLLAGRLWPLAPIHGAGWPNPGRPSEADRGLPGLLAPGRPDFAHQQHWLSRCEDAGVVGTAEVNGKPLIGPNAPGAISRSERDPTGGRRIDSVCLYRRLGRKTAVGVAGRCRRTSGVSERGPSDHPTKRRPSLFLRLEPSSPHPGRSSPERPALSRRRSAPSCRRPPESPSTARPDEMVRFDPTVQTSIRYNDARSAAGLAPRGVEVGHCPQCPASRARKRIKLPTSDAPSAASVQHGPKAAAVRDRRHDHPRGERVRGCGNGAQSGRDLHDSIGRRRPVRHPGGGPVATGAGGGAAVAGAPHGVGTTMAATAAPT